MNKLSKEQIDQVVQDQVSTVGYVDQEPLSMEDINKLVRDARLAQAKVFGDIFKSAVKALGKSFAAIGKGIRAAVAFDELARLSDRELADIGLNRDQIAGVALEDAATRSAKASYAGFGGTRKAARPTNDWVDHIAA